MHMHNITIKTEIPTVRLEIDIDIGIKTRANYVAGQWTLINIVFAIEF